MQILARKRMRLKSISKSRLILSVLVDADWSDTANYHRCVTGLRRNSDGRINTGQLGLFLRSLLCVIQSKSAACIQESIKQIRAEILQDCLHAANAATAFFSLDCATGVRQDSGFFCVCVTTCNSKQLTPNYLRRAPYLSIIEQNSQVLRDALGLFGTR